MTTPTHSTDQLTPTGVAQTGYQLFGQGDIPGILALLAEDILWTHPGNQVTNDVHIEAKCIETGKFFAVDGYNVWTLNAEGKVARWAHQGDVSAMEQAFAGE